MSETHLFAVITNDEIDIFKELNLPQKIALDKQGIAISKHESERINTPLLVAIPTKRTSANAPSEIETDEIRLKASEICTQLGHGNLNDYSVSILRQAKKIPEKSYSNPVIKKYEDLLLIPSLSNKEGGAYWVFTKLICNKNVKRACDSDAFSTIKKNCQNINTITKRLYSAKIEIDKTLAFDTKKKEESSNFVPINNKFFPYVSGSKFVDKSQYNDKDLSSKLGYEFDFFKQDNNNPLQLSTGLGPTIKINIPEKNQKETQKDYDFRRMKSAHINIQEIKKLGAEDKEDTETGSQSRVYKMIKNDKEYVVKLRQIRPFAKEEIENPSLKTETLIKRDLLLGNILEHMANKFKITDGDSKQLIQVMNYIQPKEYLEKGILVQEKVSGVTVFELADLLNRIKENKKRTSEESKQYDQDINQLKKLNTSTFSEDSKIIDATERKIAQLEAFYYETYANIDDFTTKNGLFTPYNTKILENGKSIGVPVGLDYNRGQNVIWDPKSQTFKIFDW